MEDLERVLKAAYEEGITSYSPDQRIIGIPGKTEDRPVDPDPHTEVVKTLTSLVRSILDYDDDETASSEDDDYPKVLGYTHPETEEEVEITVQTDDDMDDILDPLLRQYPDLPYSID